VEPVTPAGGATGVAGEGDVGWAIFFDGSIDEGFLRKMNHETLEKVTSNKAQV
jgi:hypothetical protein